MTIHTFRIEHKINNVPAVLFPSVLKHENKVYLIDCGYEETFDDFITGLQNLSIQPEQITGIIISHDDIDHLGGLKHFKAHNPSIRLICGEIEEPSVSGRIKSERLVQAEISLGNLPEEFKPWALRFIESLKNINRFKVDQTFVNNEIFLKDLQILHTPGHTRGHLSFYLPGEKTVIASDAIVIENGEFEIANPAFTLDMPAAIASVEKIMHLNPNKIICYHGGIMEQEIENKLTNLIQRYKD